MSEAVDTSEAEVERACRAAEAEPHFPGATLALVPLCRALLKERDEAQAEANAGRQAEHDADQERDEARARAERAEAERDALADANRMLETEAAHCAQGRDAARAVAARLRGTLTWVLNDVQAWCDAIAENGAGWDYWDDYYKSFKWGGIEKARAALAMKEPGHE